MRVELEPEGPQRLDLAPDLAAALEASPAAAAFWDELAQFYRRAYLRWIDSTKRSPALRAERITAVVALLERGVAEQNTAEIAPWHVPEARSGIGPCGRE